jgi:hypothetical protein
MSRLLLENALLRMSGALMAQVGQDPHLANPLAFIGGTLGLLGQNIDQLVARPMAEVALIKRFLADAKALVAPSAPALAERIAGALPSTPSDLRLCSINAHLEDARALLIDVQAQLEADGAGDALLSSFWRALRGVRREGAGGLLYIW